MPGQQEGTRVTQQEEDSFVLFGWATPELATAQELEGTLRYIDFLTLATTTWMQLIPGAREKYWRGAEPNLDRSGLSIRVSKYSYGSPALTIIEVAGACAGFAYLTISRSLNLIKRLANFGEEVAADARRLEKEYEDATGESLYGRRTRRPRRPLTTLQRIKLLEKLQAAHASARERERELISKEARALREFLVNQILADLEVELRTATSHDEARAAFISRVRELVEARFTTDSIITTMTSMPNLVLVVRGEYDDLVERVLAIQSSAEELGRGLEVQGFPPEPDAT